MKSVYFLKKFNNLNIFPWRNLESEIKNYDIIINATSLGLKMETTSILIFLVLKIILFISTLFTTLSKQKHIKI